MIFFLLGNYSLKADEVSGSDQEFINDLDNVKNPFEDGMPKPIILSRPMPVIVPKPIIKVVPKPKPVPPPEIVLPTLHLQGVIVGEEVHQAIIDDDVVPLNGFIKDVQVINVSKQGVMLLYKGKKFFLKVD